MDINAIQARTPNVASASATSGTKISSDFETFLTMMTTQLKNQDPLNPIDSADYAVQLATFSGVEQQAKTNLLLDSLRSEFSLMGMAQLASWVGHDARSAAPIFVESDPIDISYTPSATADRAVLAVYDAGQNLVNRVDVSAQGNSHALTPVDLQGRPLAQGIYTVKLESYAGEQLLSTTDVEHYAAITEVRAGPTGTVLLLEGGIEVAASAVTSLRN